ncbi:MAG: PAS domain S-box protein, partial [Balneolaceae bacterium]|nr:PAS domain S-box protein [Balneolaceae bacterium]
NVNTLEFVEVNRAAVEHYGYSEEEFLSMTIADIRPDEDVEKLVQAIENNKNEAIYGEEWRHVTSQGNRIAVRISATDIVYEGKPGYRLVLANDITELKQAKKKIINSFIEGEERERARIARELHDGIGQYLSAAHMNLEAVKDDLQQLPEKRGKQYAGGLTGSGRQYLRSGRFLTT